MSPAQLMSAATRRHVNEIEMQAANYELGKRLDGITRTYTHINAATAI